MKAEERKGISVERLQGTGGKGVVTEGKGVE